MKYEYIVWEINEDGFRVAILGQYATREEATNVRRNFRVHGILTEIEIIERKEK